jgi:hypothetical protein
MSEPAVLKPEVLRQSAEDARRLLFFLETMERQQIGYRDAQQLWTERKPT